MKQKSLSQLARELGVSHSYLSQVRHGKRPASEKVVSIMVSKSAAETGRGNGLRDDKNLVPSRGDCYNSSDNAELCRGSTGDFESLSPGSIPGSAAKY